MEPEFVTWVDVFVDKSTIINRSRSTRSSAAVAAAPAMMMMMMVVVIESNRAD